MKIPLVNSARGGSLFEGSARGKAIGSLKSRGFGGKFDMMWILEI